MQKFLRTLMLMAVMLLPFASQAQTDCTGLSIPYAENFDGYTGNATSTTAPTGYPAITLPDCWSFLNMSEGTSAYPQVFLTSNSSYAVSGNCLFFKSSSTTPLYAIMPDVGAQSGAWQLSFQYRNEGATASNGTIIVGYMTDATDATTFVALDTLARTTTKTLVELAIPAGTIGAGTRVAFMYQGGTANNYYASIDNVTLDVAPTCFKVTDLAIDATQTTTTSLTLTWTDALNTGATYTIYNMADTSVVASNISGTGYTVTGLDANAPYSYAVMTDCGGGDITDLTASVSGRTACAAMALPWSCGFEADEIQSTTAATALPWCSQRYVSVAATSGTTYPYSYSGSTYAHEGSRSLYFYGSTSASYPDTMAFILPQVDVTTYPMNANRVTFWARMSSASYSKNVYVCTMSDPADLTTLTLIDSVLVSGTTHTKYSVSLAAATATDAYVVLAVMKGSGTLYMDDLTLEEMPSCGDVNGLVVTGYTTSSITFSWNAVAGASYTIYDMENTSIVGTSTDTTYTVTGLTAATAYTFGVQSNCTGGDGLVATVSGRTACEGNTVFPWSENFESFAASSSGVKLEATCWVNEHISGAGAYFFEVYSSTSGMTGNTTQMLRLHDMSNGTQTKLTLPAMSFPTGTTYLFTLDVLRNATGTSYTSEGVRVFASTDGNIEGATELGFLYRNFTQTDGNVVPAESASGWYTYSFAIPAGTVYIILRGESQYGSATYMDNFVIDEAPSCMPVSGLTLDGQTATSANIHWNNSGATGYEVEVRQNDVALTTVTVVVTDTTAEISGLSIDNDYQVVVRAVCGSDYSAWSGALNIHIGYCLPNPTSVDGNGIVSVAFGGMTNTTHLGSTAGFGDYSSMSGSVPAGTTASIDITYATGYTYGTIIWVDWNNSLTFDTNEVVYTGTSTNSNPTTLTATFDIPATTALGNYRMRILAADSYFDSYTSSIAAAAAASPCGSYTWGVAEDYTLTVTEAPSCLPVTGLAVSNITAHTATLTWQGDAAGYTIWDMSDTSVYEYANDTTVVLYALSGETAYTFGVTSSCGSLESDMRTVSFTTLISCPAPANLAAVLTPGDGTVATLNWNAGGEESEWQLCLNGDMTNLVSAYDSTYDMTNLTPEQAVAAKVRAICGVGDTSAWSSEISFTPTNAYTVTVNDGTTTNEYVPVYGYYADENTKSQFIIPATDLSAMAYGTINKLTFYASNESVSWGSASFEVYLSETSETAVNSLAAVSGMTQVYTGSLSIVNNVMEFTLTTPYQYMGGNLLVAFEQPTTGTWSRSYWYGVTATGASQGGYGTSVSQRNFLPKTTIAYTPGEAPSCPAVMGLAVSNITTDGATLTWTGDAASYNVYSLPDSALVGNVAATSYSLTGLTAMTQYTYGVTAVCGTDESDIRTIGFTTACSAVALPFTENFEATSATTGCWTTDGPGTWTIATGDYTVATGAFEGSLNAKITHSNTGDITKFISPELEGVTNGLQLTFAHIQRSWSGDIDNLAVYYRTDATTAWQQVANYTTAIESWTVESVTIPGTVYQVAFEYTDNWGYGVGLDSVVFAAASGSTDTTIVDSNMVSITFAVNDATMGTTNPAPGTYQYAEGSVFSVTAVPNTGYHLADWQMTYMGMDIPLGSTDLTMSDSVDAYYDGMIITAIFESDSSAVVECDPVAIPFTENFEATSSTVNCWTLVDAAAYTGVQTSADYAYEGSSMFLFSYNTNPPQYLISPELSGTGSSLQVEFYYRTMSATYPESFVIGYSTTTNDTSAFTWGTEQTNLTNSTYEHYVEVLAAAGIKYVAIKYTANDMYYLFVDNFIARDVPTCAPVTGLTVTATTTNSVSLSWSDADNTGATYTVYDGNTPVATGLTSTSYTVTGLTPGTAYTIGVEANCSATDASDMVTVIAQTECVDVTTLPYSEGFENGSLGCWTTVNGSADGQPWSVYPGTTNTLPHSGNYVASSWSWQSTAMNADAWLISPKFVLPTVAAGDSLTFAWWEATNASYPDSYSVAVSTTTNDTASFVTVRPSTVAAGTWTMQSIDLTAYAGQSIYVAFHHVDYDANYLFIDDISMSVGAAPVPAPDTLTVTIAVNDATMGSTSPAPGTYQYLTGDTLRVSATPNTGYVFNGWNITYGDGTVDSLSASYASLYAPAAALMEDGPITFLALFGPIDMTSDSMQVNVAVNDPTMGTTVPAPGTHYFHVGEAASVVAVPNDGYHLTGWTINMTRYNASYDTTITAIDTTIDMAMDDVFDLFGGFVVSEDNYDLVWNVTANFAAGAAPVIPDSVIVNVSVNDATMGTVTPAPGTHYYVLGDTVLSGFQPNAGYYTYAVQMSISHPVYGVIVDTTITDTAELAAVAGVLDTLLIVEDPDMYGMIVNINVIFAAAGTVPDVYTVSVGYDMSRGTVTGQGDYVEGSTVTLTAVAFPGYEFYAWVEDNDTVGRQTVYTINNIDRNHNLTAVFVVKTGIEDVEADNVNIYSTDNVIVVRGAEGKQVVLFDVNGRMLSREARAAERVEFRVTNSGVYLVKVANAAAKRVVVIR